MHRLHDGLDRAAMGIEAANRSIYLLCGAVVEVAKKVGGRGPACGGWLGGCLGGWLGLAACLGPRHAAWQAAGVLPLLPLSASAARRCRRRPQVGLQGQHTAALDSLVTGGPVQQQGQLPAAQQRPMLSVVSARAPGLLHAAACCCAGPLPGSLAAWLASWRCTAR